MKIQKIDKSELSDLDIKKLPDGFAIVFEKDNPVGAILSYDYYRYITKLIAKVKKYVEKAKSDR